MQTIKLDIAQKNNVPRLYVKQRDVGHTFAIELYENGVPYTVDENNTFAVWYSGASGEGNYTNIGDETAVFAEGNVITGQMILQMLQNPGDHEMCVVMYGQDNEQKGFWNIPYCVEEIPGADSEGATEYYNAFLDAQKKAEEAAGRAEAAAEKINVDQEYIETQVFAAGGAAEVAATAARDAEAAAARAEAVAIEAVSYNPQEPTVEQQAQARENIGAVGHSDLEVKAECNATSLSVTQESNYGVSNDKIVQLDGLEAVVVNANNNNVCFSIEYYGNRFYVYGANSLKVNNNDVLLLYTSEDVEAKSRKYDIVFEAKDYKYLICTTAYNCAEYNIAKINAYTYPDALTINGNEVSRPKDISDAIYSHSDDAHIYKESAKLDSMTTSTQVISAFDALMNDHPNYITKNDLGADSAGNRIYEYVFGSGKINDYAGHNRPMDSAEDKPVILLLSGVHGYERSCVMGTYLFAKALAEKKIFAKMRNKYIVKIIPLSVPSAYDLNTYENSNGVNIDCNFDFNWTKDDGVHPNGEAPADQLETQILQAWMDNNPDALVMINYHNSGYTEEISYMSGDSSHLTTGDFKEKFFDAMYRIEDYLKQTYVKDNAVYAYTGHYTLPTGYNYANKVGLVGLLLEASWNVTNNGTNNDAISNKANAEILGNLMLECFD